MSEGGNIDASRVTIKVNTGDKDGEIETNLPAIFNSINQTMINLLQKMVELDQRLTALEKKDGLNMEERIVRV